jgi:hypothetical protein
VGAALMRAAEATALECGKTLLVLDSVTGGDATRLYERLGWVRVGEISDHALFPQGGWCSTTVYYRKLATPQPERARRDSAPVIQCAGSVERMRAGMGCR